jgi:hypothetical protein
MRRTDEVMDDFLEGIPAEHHAEAREAVKKTLLYQKAALADALADLFRPAWELWIAGRNKVLRRFGRAYPE